MTAEDEVVDLCRDLIRIDTSNSGDHSGPGERKAAEHVAALLAEVGLEPEILESHPGRASVVARIDRARTRPGPRCSSTATSTSCPPTRPTGPCHPFSGEIADGCVWGRGAVDMKDMDAMILAVVRQRLREGRRPPRDVVLVFIADEEAGGNWGARWLVDKHPDLFEGVTEAIGEVGGFSVTIGGQRLYLMQTAEKGMAWMRLTAAGTAGHGSMVQTRQRGDRAGRGRGAGRAARVAAPADPGGRGRSWRRPATRWALEFTPDAAPRARPSSGRWPG